jgi:hypothetical protein
MLTNLGQRDEPYDYMSVHWTGVTEGFYRLSFLVIDVY